MLGRRSGQRTMFSSDHLDLAHVGEQSIYAFFARHHQALFRDADFAVMYRAGGRPSVPPTLLAIALLLQRKHRLSDQQLIDATRYDLRFKVALQLEHHEGLCAKSTLQHFRAGLVIHKLERIVFDRTVALAKEAGLLNAAGLDLALDTTPMLGRGAVKDTVNLLGDGIRQIVRELARLSKVSVEQMADELTLQRYVQDAPSLKASADIDWQNVDARDAFVAAIVADADGVLATARAVRAAIASSDADDGTRLEAASELLATLLAQDIARDDDDPAGRGRIKRGTALDRIVSVHDPEMRHGRKSSSTRFDGHKIATAVDVDSGIFLDCDLLAGNETDQPTALAITERVEATHDVSVAATLGDGAYGSGAVRQAFADAGRTLIAKLPRDARTGTYTKRDFTIHLGGERGEEPLSATCPAGHTTHTRQATTASQHGESVRAYVFRFDAATCAACPLKARCTKGKGQRRSLRAHPQEALMQQARAELATPTVRARLRKRVRVEHGNARLVQLDARQSRYVGRAKSRLQVLFAAAFANLTRVLTRLTTAPTTPCGDRSRHTTTSSESRSLLRTQPATGALLALLLTILFAGYNVNRRNPAFRPRF